MDMINEKKIEEAARNYCNNRYPASQDAPFIAEGFRHGAKWAVNEFLKNLWHPASEEPEEHTDIIYIDEDKDFWDINNYDSNNFDDFFFGKGWESACRTQDIYKWAYKDDLFPMKGGEQ